MERPRQLLATALALVTSCVSLGAQTFETTLTPPIPMTGSAVFHPTGVDLEGNTLVVGGTMGTDMGFIDLFTWNGSTWNATARLQPSTPVQGTRFLGMSLDYDNNAILAGSWDVSDGNWNDPGYQRGGAFVFRRIAESWSEEAFLQPASVVEADLFGHGVALSGDVAVVGAPYADPLGERSGRVWVFRRAAGTWTEEASLTPADGAPGDHFGSTVAVEGSTLVISAPLAEGTAAQTGAVYYYEHDGTAWTLQQKIVDTSGTPNDHFGHALSLDGDTLAIGAPRRAAPGALHAGAVGVFTRSGATWTPQAWLVANDARLLGNLGTSVSLDGDFLLAGTPSDDDAASGAGAGYVFARTAGSWTQTAKLLAPNASIGDSSGLGVALDGGRGAIPTNWRMDGALSVRSAVDLWTDLGGGAP